MNPQGILLVNKPKGITSFKALAPIKRKFGVKVGHTGTLDRFAEGLLVVLIGSMTRMNPMFTGFDKSYEAVITFGKETDTLDPEGKVILEGEIPNIEQIKMILPTFVGESDQTPPQFSAVHVGGKRAYKLALAGEEVNIPPRRILIHDLRFISWEAPELKISVSCSKGTYIRSLARDIAYSLETCAHVTELKRTIVGQFDITDSTSPEELDLEHIVEPWDIFDVLGGISKITVDSIYIKSILCGSLPKDKWILTKNIIKDSTLCGVFTPDKELLGVCICTSDSNDIKYESYKFVVAAGNR